MSKEKQENMCHLNVRGGLEGKWRQTMSRFVGVAKMSASPKAAELASGSENVSS